MASLKKSAPKTYKSTAAVSDDDDLFNLLADEKEEKVKHRPKFRAKSQAPREKENSELQKTPSEETVDRPKSRKGPVKLPEKLPETITSALEPASGSRETSGPDILTLDSSGGEKKASGLIKRGSNEATKRGKGRLCEFVVEEEDDLLSGMGLDDGSSSHKPRSLRPSGSAVHETVQEEVKNTKSLSEERNPSTKGDDKAEDEDSYVFGGYTPSISSSDPRRKDLPTSISTGGSGGSLLPERPAFRGRNTHSSELQMSGVEVRKPAEIGHKEDFETEQMIEQVKPPPEVAGRPAKKSVRFAGSLHLATGTNSLPLSEELHKGEKRENGEVSGQETTTDEEIQTLKTGGERDILVGSEPKLEHPVFPWQQRRQKRRDGSTNPTSLTSRAPPPIPDTLTQQTTERSREGEEGRSGDDQQTLPEPRPVDRSHIESLKAKVKSLETRLELPEQERQSLAERVRTAAEEKRELLGATKSKDLGLTSQLDQLRAKVHRLECERDQLKTSVENMKTHSTEEQAAMDKSHSARIQALEESFQRREAKWREELETETAHHRERLEQADRDKTDSMLALRKKMEALGLSKTNEIAQLQEIHRSAVADMKIEHEMDLNRVKDMHRQEVEALKAAHSHTQRLSELSSQVEETIRAVSGLQARVEQTHRQNLEDSHQNSLTHQQNLKTLEERLGKQYREVESHRELLRSVVGRLETHLSQQAQSLEGERWSLQQESARVKAAERALEEQRNTLLARLEEERREITDSKEKFLAEQQKLLSECLSERHSLASERARLAAERKTFAEVEKRVAQRRQEIEAECAVTSEERARLSMEATRLQQEESRLRSESAHVEQLRLAVERERATLLDKMNLAESSGQEANRLNQSSLALQREGEEKMAAAERLQMELAQQAEVVKRERRELEERESQLVSERLAFARECREHQENHLQSEFVHSQPTPILTSTRRTSNAFTAGLDLSHSFPQPLRPSSSRRKHKEGDDNESHQQSSHQEEQSLREERELLATIQHQNSLMLISHYNRPYLPRNETLTS